MPIDPSKVRWDSTPATSPTPQGIDPQAVQWDAPAAPKGLLDSILSGFARGDAGAGIRRGATSTLASTLHTGADLLDQALAPATALYGRDPLGFDQTAASALGVEQLINGDRQAAAEAIGGRPSVADFRADPKAALEQGIAHLTNMGSESLPVMAAAVATRNPELGSFLMGSTTGAQEYTDLRGQGVPRGDAAQAAALTGAIESAGEAIGLPAILNKSGKGALVKAVLENAAQEAPVQLAQQAIEDQATGQQTPIGEQFSGALDAALVGGTVGGGAHVAVNAPDLARSAFGAARKAAGAVKSKLRPSDVQWDDVPDPQAAAASASPAPAAPAAPAATAPPVSPALDPEAELDALLAGKPDAVAPANEPISLAERVRQAQQAQAARENADRAARLAELDQAITAKEQANRPARGRNAQPDETVDDALTFLAKRGGLDRRTFVKEGIDPAVARAPENKTRGGASRPLFRAQGTGGMSLDQVAETLWQHGYLPSADNNAALDLIMAGVNNDAPIYSIHRQDQSDLMALQQAKQDAENAPPADYADVPFSRKPAAASEFTRNSRVKGVLYHATNADFDTFDTTRGDLGVHLGTTEQANKAASRGHGANSSVGPNIMPVHASLTNPLRLKDTGSFHAWAIADQLARKGIISKDDAKRIEAEGWREQKKNNAFVRQAIEAKGYDSVVYKNEHEGKGDSYIALRPEQIKSATGNNGNFDPSDPRVNFSFAGERAQTADRRALEQAQQMEAMGRNSVPDRYGNQPGSPEDTHIATGWHRGVDGKWKFEIDDSAATVNRDVLEPGKVRSRQLNALIAARQDAFKGGDTSEVARLSAQIKEVAATRAKVPRATVGEVLNHSELFRAYPELANVKVRVNPLTTSWASYNTGENTIEIRDPSVYPAEGNRSLKSVLLHEIQHAIQAHEGFARGGNSREVRSMPEFEQTLRQYMADHDGQLPSWTDVRPHDDAVADKAAHEVYRRLAGEVEARNTQNRMTMDAGQRRAVPPSETADVPRSQQIVRFNNPTTAERSGPNAQDAQAIATYNARLSEYIGQPVRFTAATHVPESAARALAAFDDAFGSRTIVVHNETPDALDLNGVTLRDGVRLVNEDATSPLLTVAAHEMVHQMRKDAPELYAELEAEVRRQGRLDAYGAELNARARASGENRDVDPRVVAEELTADATGDALSDPDFIDRMAQQNPGLFRRLAQRLMDFFDSLTRKLRDLGSSKYLRDVEAFRTKLADVLERYGQRQQGKASAHGETDPAFQRVYHGTPHTVDKFSLQKIGTGEGAQAYGWGMYFASEKAIAEHYRKGLTARDFINKARDAYDEYFSPDEAVQALKSIDGLSDAQKELIDALQKDDWLGFDYPHQGISAALKQPQNFELSPATEAALAKQGNLYHVEVPEDSDLLDWDKPLSQQPSKVREALKLAGFPAEGSRDPAGKTMYGGMVSAVQNAQEQGWKESLIGIPVKEDARQAVSEYLNSIGIPGLRYLDGSSRAKGEGSANYVIWDEQAIGSPEPALSRKGVPEYQGEHEAPMADSGSPLYDVTANGHYPEDVYSHQGLRYYGTGEHAMDAQAHALITRMRGKPNGTLEVYRAVPKSVSGKIARGDWVTPIRAYAVEHGQGALGGDYKIQKLTVRPRDLFTNGDSWLEWGYDPQPYDPESDAARREGRPYTPKKSGGPALSRKNESPYTDSMKQRRINAAKQRAEGGSLAEYGAREQREWLGENPPSDGVLMLYRAVRHGEKVNPGDYVSNSRAYAKQHLRDNMGGDGEIIAFRGHMDEIFPADSPREFFYLPRSLDGPDTALSRKPSATDQTQTPEGSTRLWHGGNKDLKEIQGGTGPGNIFGGIFASRGRDDARSHGDGSLYAMDVPDERILTQAKLDGLPEDQVDAALRKSMHWLGDADFDAARQAVIDQRELDPEEMIRVFQEETAGEASWEAQRIRGDVARQLGYQAVEMDDEHGTSYLVLPGVQPVPESQIRPEPSYSKTKDPNEPSILFSRKPVYTDEQKAFMRKAGMAEAVDPQSGVRGALEALRQLKPTVDSDAFRQGAIDQFHGLKRAVDEKGGIAPEDNPYLAAEMIQIASTMEAVLRYGAPKLENGVLRVDRSVPGLLDALGPVRDAMPEWLGWMVARRAKVLKAQGRENAMSDADIAAGLTLATGREAPFKEAALGYLKLKNAILDLAEQAGVIDPEARKAWDHAEYVPFYRAMDTGAGGPGTRQGLANQSSGIRTLKGGESPLKDPLGNIIANFTRLIDSSLKNRATLLAVDQLGAPYFRKAALEMKAETVPLDQVKKHLREQGVDAATIASMPPGALKGVARLLAVKAPEGDDVVRVMRGGKAEYYHVDDPLLLRALTAFNESGTPTWLKPLVWAKQLLTAGATGTPDFLLRNALRDTGEATVTSKDSFMPVVDTVRGAIDSLRESELAQDLMMAGAAFHGGLFHTGNNEDTAKAIRRALRKGGLDDSAIKRYVGTLINPKRMWDVYRAVAEATEMGSRVSLARKRLAAGAPMIEAAHEAKDFLNFQRRGDSQFMVGFSKVIPFLNARVQGADRLYRVGTTKGRRGKVAARLAVMALLSTLLYWWNDREHKDAYDEIPDWDKDANWHIAPGTDYHVRIPKPFELGLVGGTVPERMYGALKYQLTQGMEGDRGEQTWEAFMRGMGQALGLNPIPQGAMPLVEDFANKDFYFGSPIESMGDRYKAPSDRYGPTTSLPMRAASKGMAKVVGEDHTISPKRLEHLWKGYTGGMGQYVLDGADWAMRTAENAPKTPAWALRDFPLVGAVATGGGPPRTTRYVDEFYALAEEAQMHSGQIKDALHAGDTVRAAKLEKQWGWLIGSRAPSRRAKEGFMHDGLRQINRVRNDLSEISKNNARIYADRAMSAEAKRQALDANLTKRNAMVRQLVRKLRLKQNEASR